MLVYAAFECRHNGYNTLRQLHKLFKNELDALLWTEEVPTTEWDWRFYQPIELE